MVELTEEEKEILKKAQKIQRKMEEDIDMVPDDFGEPVKKKKESGASKSSSTNKKKSEKTTENNSVPKEKKTKKGRGKKKTKKSKVKRLGRFLWACIFALLVLLVIFYWVARYISAKTDYQPCTTEYVRASDVMSQSRVKNILIIGTDERHENEATRSDVLMILSINEKTNKIVLSSILRDSFVTIPGKGQDRINAAYQFGGASLAIQTIEENFKIAIDHYIKIDFYSFVEIVDAVGGVEIDVDEGEMKYINAYLAEINSLLGVDPTDGTLQSPGYLLLNGKQALSYARIRYIGTDFQRTQRQREVVEGILKQVKTMNPVDLYKMTDIVFPEIVTDLDENTMAMIMMKSVFYLGYDIEQNRIPIDGTWSNSIIDGKDVLSIDFEANRQGLWQSIYGD